MLLPWISTLLVVARSSSVQALITSFNSTYFNNTQTAVFPNATSVVQDIASACNEEYISYSEASSAFHSTGTVWVTKTVTNTIEYNQTIFSRLTYDCTQKCDTICYAGNISSTVSISSVSSQDTVTYSLKEDYSKPTPSCSIGLSDCLSLLTSYSAAQTKWSSDRRSSITTAPYPRRPACSACVATTCAFQDAGMSLYYWPVTTSYSRDMCAWDPVDGRASTYIPDMNRTYTPITTGPYAIVEGRTLYQGNVYLSIADPYVYDNCGSTVPRKNQAGDNMITIASTDLYSVRKYPHNLIPWSVNFADFIEPVPWSAYLGGRYCANNRPLCSVIFPGDYQPEMVMPPQMRNLDPAWESCSFDQYGLFDPPIALQTAIGFLTSSSVDPALSTPTDGPTGVPPAPGNSLPPAVPTETAAPSTGNGDGNGPGKGDETDKSKSNPPPTQTANDPAQPANPHSPPIKTANDPSQPAVPNVPPVITVGPSVIPIDPTGGVVIAPGTTLSQGGPGIVISSTSLSVGDSGLVIVSPSTSTNIAFPSIPSTISIPGLSDPVVLNPTSNSPGHVVIAPGTTLWQGGPSAVISSTTFSIGSSGLVIVSPSTSTNIAFPAIPSTVSIPGLSDPVVLSPNEGDKGIVVLAPGTTLSPGGASVVISSTTFSVGSTGLVIMSPPTSTNIAFPPVPSTISIPGLSDPVVLSPTGEGNGIVVLAPGTTLSRGGPGVVVASTTFSVGDKGLVIIAPAMSTQMPIGAPGAPNFITFPGLGVQQVMTLDSMGRLVMQGGKLLRMGDPAVTIDGTTISVGASEIVVVHGDRTERYPVPVVTTTQDSGVEALVVSTTKDLEAGGDKTTRVLVTSAEGTGTGTAVTGGSHSKGAGVRAMSVHRGMWVSIILGVVGVVLESLF